MIRLRSYQREALRTWLKNGRKGIIELPTGTGKTWLGLALLERHYKNKRVVIIVPTEVLLKQWYQKILENTSIKRRSIGFLYGKEKNLRRKVIIGIINTAVKYADILAKRYDLFILDEVHHYFAPRWNSLLEKIKDKDVLGLSATAERSDKLHEKSYLKVIYTKSYDYMLRRKYVAKVDIKIVHTELTEKESTIYYELDEKIKEVAKKLDDAEFWGENYTAEKYRKILMILANKRRQLCSESVTKPPVIAQILRKHRKDRVIVFTESKKTVEQLYRYLSRYKSFKCGVVHSGIKKRHRILEGWKRGEFNVLLTVRVLDEGIDVPECSVGVIVSNSLAKRQLVQRIGRIVRPRPRKVAKIYIVVSKYTFEERVARRLERLLRYYAY